MQGLQVANGSSGARIMTSIKAIAVLAPLAAALALVTAGSLQASEAQDRLTMEPLQGISFDAGSKRAVSFFVAKSGFCELVVTFAEEPNWDEPEGFVFTHFEATIADNRATVFCPHSGKALQFACDANATAMSVAGIDQVATIPHD
jgi:hypothetical protein